VFSLPGSPCQPEHQGAQPGLGPAADPTGGRPWCAQRLVDQLGELDPVTRRFLSAAADTAAARWQEKPTTA
jgi:hypothetical protein